MSAAAQASRLPWTDWEGFRSEDFWITPKFSFKAKTWKHRNFSREQPSLSAIFQEMGTGAETVSLIIMDQNDSRDPHRTEDPWCSPPWPQCPSVLGQWRGGRQFFQAHMKPLLLPRSMREIWHSLAPAISTWVLQPWRQNNKASLPPKRVNTTRYSKHSTAVVTGSTKTSSEPP